MKQSRIFNLLMGVVMIVATMIGAQPASAQQGTDIDRNTLFVPGEVVVGFSSGKTAKAYGAQASALAGEVEAQVVDLKGNTVLLSFAEDADVEALSAQLAEGEGVAYAQPNYISWIPEENPLGARNVSTEIVRQNADGERATINRAELSAMRTVRRGKLGVPTYPVEGADYDNWGWWQINASVIWPEKKVSATACIVDTGADILHPDLAGKVTNGPDFVNDDAIPNDDNGHGTHVAGTIVATTNNKKGFSGISNGKAIAVKVLSAQGWGTSFDIAAGIRYCADQAAVKVINMSLGGSEGDPVEFDALQYAIVTKGKLVVAAAGNADTANYSFPAAWAADYVCADGSDAFGAACAVGNENTIDQGLIAVGAGRSWGSTANDSDYSEDLWVDSDGDGIAELGETYYMEECATDFSNYGEWVEIVAPGEGIFSSVPVSYPYYANYYEDMDGDGDGYEWFDGTSMATPHVVGAAVRILSVQPTTPVFTNVMLKQALINSGVPLSVASDPNMTDAADGYYDDVGDPNGYGGEAPYCWPDDTEGARYDMSASVYLDVAAGMDRTAFSATVVDATTGLPLTGATVSAYQGTALKDTALLSSKTNRWVDLINLPAGVENIVKVTKAGYTTGAAAVATITPSFHYEYNETLAISVPPVGRITLVANWLDEGIDLDLYTFLPVSSGGAVVGAGGSFHPDDIGAGDLSTTGFEKTRWNRDGGFSDWMGLESVTMLATGIKPYYNLTTTDKYDFFLTDYGSGDLNYSPIVVRLWRGGLPVPVGVTPFPAAPYAYILSDTCDTDGVDDTPGTTDDEVWYHIGHLGAGPVAATAGSTFIFDDNCGVGATGGGSNVWPYATTNSISTAFGK